MTCNYRSALNSNVNVCTATKDFLRFDIQHPIVAIQFQVAFSQIVRRKNRIRYANLVIIIWISLAEPESWINIDVLAQIFMWIWNQKRFSVVCALKQNTKRQRSNFWFWLLFVSRWHIHTHRRLSRIPQSTDPAICRPQSTVTTKRNVHVADSVLCFY